MARLVSAVGDAVTLQGGLALEFRVERARTTKDVHPRMMGSPENVLARLQEAVRLDLKDFMDFEVRADALHPQMQNESLQASYVTMASLDALPWATLTDVTQAARSFLGPVLSRGLDATWEPGQWR